MTNWDGETYRQVADLQHWLGAQALRGVEVRGDERVLDIGCGDGRITTQLAERLPRGTVIGIDPSPRMIEVAVAGSGVSFQLGDVLSMRFEREFDLAVSFNALHWVREQAAAVARIKAALRSPGRAVLQFVCRGDRPSLERVAMQVCGGERWRGHFRDFVAPFVHPDPEAYAELARQAGMDVVGLTVEDLRWDFDTADAFAQWCFVGFSAWTAQLPDLDTAHAFVHDVMNAYAAVTGSPQAFMFMQLRITLTT